MKNLVIGVLLLSSLTMSSQFSSAQSPTSGMPGNQFPECSKETRGKLEPLIRKALPTYAGSNWVCADYTDYHVTFSGVVQSELNNIYTWKVTVSFGKDLKHLTYQNLLEPTDFRKLVDFIENQPVCEEKTRTSSSASVVITDRKINSGAGSENGVFINDSNGKTLQFFFDDYDNTLAVYTSNNAMGGHPGAPIQTISLDPIGLKLKTATVNLDDFKDAPMNPIEPSTATNTSTTSPELSTDPASHSIFSGLISALKSLVESLKNLVK